MKQKIECLLAWLKDHQPKEWFNIEKDED